MLCVAWVGPVWPGVGIRSGMMKRALWQGVVSGAAGMAVMTLSEKAEQRWTARPNSYVPGRVLRRLLGLGECPGPRSLLWSNWAMHFGQGVALGVLRSIMAHVGLRGVWSSAKFAVVRVTNDQILENATGVGAPPSTWPRRELVVDLLHKAVYAFTTGVVADVLAARSGLGPGQRHAAARPGRRGDVGPVSWQAVSGR